MFPSLLYLCFNEYRTDESFSLGCPIHISEHLLARSISNRLVGRFSFFEILVLVWKCFSALKSLIIVEVDISVEAMVWDDHVRDNPPSFHWNHKSPQDPSSLLGMQTV